MKKSIFTVYVPITSQEQADRLKQVCLDNKLMSFYNSKDMWTVSKLFPHFGCHRGYFGLFDLQKNIQATEQEFMELLKQLKDG